MFAMLRKPASSAGMLWFAILAVGCASVGPDFQKPEVDIAEAWLQAEDERVDTARTEYEDWWAVFEDPAL
ncbi:MAG: transporter, partial [Gammaproteobacteria bacterium]|nr:transporter [Gammaproteobacteria bacterium]